MKGFVQVHLSCWQNQNITQSSLISISVCLLLVKNAKLHSNLLLIFQCYFTQCYLIIWAFFTTLTPAKWKSLSRVWLFATPWTIQSLEFSRPEYWSGLPFPFHGIFPTQKSNPCLLCLQHWQADLYHCTTWEVQCGVCIYTHTHTHTYTYMYSVSLLSGDLIQYDRCVAYKQQKFIAHSSGD